jgi:hypothetical protein
MSDIKRRDVEQHEGITIGRQIDLPKSLRKSSYEVELRAKISRGYFSSKG